MSQANKLYNAEDQVPYLYKGPMFSTLDDALYRLRNIVRSQSYTKLKVRPPWKIQFVEPQVRWCARYLPLTKTIQMTPNGRRDLVLLHELAHHVWYQKYPYRSFFMDAHGSRYAGIYIHLVREFADERYAFADLANKFIAFGVKYQL